MNKIHIYTDGGCRGNQSDNNIGAWGVYLKYNDFEKKLSGCTKNTTNNIMELTGCINGLKAIKNKNIDTIVYLDSSYVLNGITKWCNSWEKNNWVTSDKKDVKNKELWIELLNIKNEFKHIDFIKVKGHSTNHGNNIADKLCNEEMDKLQNKKMR